MKVRRIPDNTLAAICALLQPHCSAPLTPDIITSMMRSYPANGTADTSQPTKPILLRVREVANRLQCSDRQVWRLIEDSKLRKVMLGPRTARVPEDSVNNLIRGVGK